MRSLFTYDYRKQINIMKLNEPKYALVRTNFDETEWIFRESNSAYEVTIEFDAIIEKWGQLHGLTSELRKFLNKYPWHFDAMNHYANCKLHSNRALDAFAFAQTSVSLAKQAFPDDFDESIHKIPGGYVENRPFLRCLYQLMSSYAALEDYEGASRTASELISYDCQDRMGARLDQVKYLIKLGHYSLALDLFEDERFKGTFDVIDYLYPIVLFQLGKKKEAKKSIDDCLYKPRVAKYLLDPSLPIPEEENHPFKGAYSGSELEGYLYGNELRDFWLSCGDAINLLLKKSQKAKEEGWPPFLTRSK